MTYTIIRTSTEYNREYNHGEGYTAKELDQADKKSMLRTRKGLMGVIYALDDFEKAQAGKMTDEEATGYRECKHELETSLYCAIEELDLLIEARGFLPKREG